MKDYSIIEKIQNIYYPQTQYFGSKEKLGSFIIENINRYIGLHKIRTVFDAFCGSAYVGYIFKVLGKRVIGNDYLKFNYHIAKSLLENNSVRMSEADIERLFNLNKKRKDFLEKNYSNLFYTKKECQTLDNFRCNIDEMKGIKKSLAFAIMIKVLINMIPFGKYNYTTAISYRNSKFKSYIKFFDIKDKFTEYAKLWNGAICDNGKNNKAYCLSTTDLVENIKADLIYIDPPYAGTDFQDYYRYYHFLETFVNYPKSSIFIKKTKEIPREKSKFSVNEKEEILIQFRILFERAKHIPYWVLSHNTNGYPAVADFKKLIREIDNERDVRIIERAYTYKSGYKRKTSYEYLLISTKHNGNGHN